MTIGMHTLQLASALVVEKRLEADRLRRWRIAPAAGISARATPERERPGLRGGLVERQLRQA
ncbi:MAG: hypothetical protein ABIJ48_10285 [Actinomycetota bacterium]